MRRLSLFLAAALLVAAIVMILLPPNLQIYYAPKTSLSEWLPAAAGGWTYEDKPIAETPEMKESVSELLNFSDGVLRVYQKGNRQLAVYIAYWQPGLMDPRLVAVHSPDVCWVGAGWKSVGGALRADALNRAGKGLRAGELRTFEAGGQHQNVLFWHFVGGKPSGYMGRSASAKSFWSWDTILRNPRAPRFEQWFVRISTSGKLADFEGEPLWDELLAKLAQISEPL
jgi:hypothetical protein